MSRMLSFIALSAVFLLAACAGDGNPPSAGDTGLPTSADDAQTGQDLPDGVAAEVGDVTIASAQLAERTDAALDDPQIAEQLPDDPEQAERAVQVSALGQMIVTEAVLQAAEAEGIAVTDRDVAAQREQLEQQAGGADALQQQVDAIGLTRTHWTRNCVASPSSTPSLSGTPPTTGLRHPPRLRTSPTRGSSPHSSG